MVLIAEGSYFRIVLIAGFYCMSKDIKRLDYTGCLLHNDLVLQVICILGETLEPFDDDGIIPAYGFGDIVTKDRSIFPLKPDVSIIIIIYAKLTLNWMDAFVMFSAKAVPPTSNELEGHIAMGSFFRPSVCHAFLSWTSLSWLLFQLVRALKLGKHIGIEG